MSPPRLYRRVPRRFSALRKRYAGRSKLLWPVVLTKSLGQLSGISLAEYLQQMRISRTEFRKRARLFGEWLEQRPPLDRTAYSELVPAFCLMGIEDPVAAAHRIVIRLMSGKPIKTRSRERFFIATQHGYSEDLDGVDVIEGVKVDLCVQINGIDRRKSGGRSTLEQDMRHTRLYGNADSVRIELKPPHSQAGRALTQLCEAGLIYRLRTCKACGAWFYAQFRHRRFCTTKCQQKHYRSNPKWRAHRRKWMRDYRKIVALPNVK
jgi:hypothetical protein